MTVRRATFLMLAATALMVAPVGAQTGDLVLGARPQGLGGAYAAVADDANAVYWNAGGLGRLDERQVTFTHWIFADVSQVTVDHAAFAHPAGPGSVGLSWTRQGARLEEGPDAVETTMSVNSFLVSYGVPLSDLVSAGLTLNRTLVSSTARSNGEVAFDAGLMIRPVDGFSVGVTARNLGGDQVLRPTYGAGAAYRFDWESRHLLLAMQVHTQDGIDGTDGTTVKYAAGLEFAQHIDDVAIALRAGVNSRTLSGGFGLAWKTFSVDYAYVSMRETSIGDSHKIGISYAFGR